MEPTIERLMVAAMIEEDIRLAAAARRAAAVRRETRDSGRPRRRHLRLVPVASRTPQQ